MPKTLSGIAVTTPPAKTTYSEGESFDPAGMVVKATYNDGTTEPVTGYTIDPGTPLTAANTSVKITYNDKSTTQAITVKAKTVDHLGITTPPNKGTYNEGETFDPAGMVITAYYNNGTEAVVTDYTMSPSGPLVPSDKSVTISFGGRTVSQAITVNELTIDHIAIATQPSKVGYYEGDTFSTAGMVVKAYFTNGSNMTVSGYTVSPNRALTTTDTYVEISYRGQTVQQTISVYALLLDHIAITKAPTKTTYVEGSRFDPAGMVVSAYYNSGAHTAVTAYTLSPDRELQVGDNLITVTYEGKTATQAITVTLKALDHIGITTAPLKLIYNEGELFDPAGMAVTAYFDNGTNQPVTDYTWAPATALTTAAKKVTISYSGKTVDQPITVKALVHAQTPVISPDTPVDFMAIDVGTPVSLTVSAHVTTGTLTYQWFRNTTGVVGEGTAVGASSSDPALTLDTSAVGTSYYYCVVTNDDPTATGNKTATATSRVAQIVVRTNAQTPIIDVNSPLDTPVYKDSVSSITIDAYVDAGALSYQWYRNTTESYEGATPVGSSSASLSLNTSTVGTLYYYCVVTNTDEDAPGVKTATATSRIARVDVSAFNKGMVLFTFDDGWKDTYTDAYPIMSRAGFKATVFVNSEFIEYNNDGFMNLSEVKSLYNAGWDVANHTANHEDIGNLTDEASMERLKANYSNCANWLITNNMPNAAYHAAYPSGLYSADLIRLLKNLGFKTGRATGYGLQYGVKYQNSFFKLPVYSVVGDDDIEACLQGVDQVANGGSTIIFLIHRVQPEEGDLVTTSDRLQTLVDYVKTKVNAGKVSVMTTTQWYAAQNKNPIGETPSAPNVTNDDVANTVSGMNLVMEYKLDDAASYTAYSPAAFGSLNLTGNHTLAVRYAASGVDPAGPDTILTFTKTLQSISITTQPTKTEYVEGTSFDAAGMVVTAHYDDGTSADVTDYTVAPVDPLAITDQKVTVSHTYLGITKTVDQAVTVTARKLTGITIDTPPAKTSYIEGNTFSPAGMVVTAHYDNNTSEAVTDYTFSPADALKTTDQKVTVSCTIGAVTKTADQAITVRAKALASIEITTPPTKTSYIEGNTFSAAGMVVTAHFDNGTSAAVTDYTLDPARALTVLDSTITVSYAYEGVTRSANQAIQVRAKALDHIAITKAPTKTVYTEGSLFSTAGMEVTAYFDNGTSAPVLGYSIFPSSTLSLTDTKVSIIYTYAGVTRSVEQEISVQTKLPVRIEITQAPSKLAYVEGTSFSPAGMVVTAFYDNDTSAPVTGYSIEPAGALAITTTKVTIRYADLTAEQPITVRTKALASISIPTPPLKTAYIEGNSFDPDGMVVQAFYDNGTSAIVTNYTVEPGGPLATADTKVTVSYTAAGVTKTADQAITVRAKKLASISITKQPAKTAYIEGNTFSTAGMELTAFFDNGTSAVVTGYTINPNGALATADSKVTVSYTFGGVTKTADQAIVVKPKSLASITIDTPPAKTSYIEGNTFSAAGMVVTAHFDNDTSEAVTDYTFSPADALKTTDQKVTVSCTIGAVTKTADQAITVRAKALASIEITTPPAKTSYIEGNTFSAAGMVVTAHFDNGTSAVVTDYTLDPIRALTVLDSTITVSYAYEGVTKTANQAIQVRAKALDHIAITKAPTKTVYTEGSLFSTAGMEVTAYFDNGTSAPVLGYLIFPSSTLSITDTKVSIIYTYASVTRSVEQEISVQTKLPVRIEITQAPSKLAYVEGTSFSPAGMVVTAFYDNDTSAAVTGFSIEPAGALAITTTKVTIRYADLTAEQPISVRTKALASISIPTPPLKTAYIEGNSFDPNGMAVLAFYDNDTSAFVTNYTVEPGGPLATADDKVTVSFTVAGVTKTADQAITVRAKKLTGITISLPPTKTAYVEGSLFDPAGMVVLAHYDNNTNEAVTSYALAPNAALSTADTKITVSYEGKSADQEITVRKKALTGITIDTPPAKIVYVEGEVFNPAGLAVSAHYDNGTSEAVTGYACAPTTALASTIKKITVSYNGMTADQAITVLEKGKLKITVKESTGAAYPGVGLKFYQDANLTVLVGTGVSDASGLVTVSGLNSATYWATVSSVPAGYQLPSVKVPFEAAVGTVKGYNLVIPKTQVRGYRNDQLRAISVTSGKLSPAFDQDVYKYTLTLGETVSKVTISPVLADSKSKLYINGSLVSSVAVTLNPGQSSAVTVKVVAGKVTTYYYVTVVRSKSTNATLASLKPSVGTMSPAFKNTTTSYSVPLAYAQTSTTISLGLADKYATYTMTLDGKATTSKSIALNPGQTRKFAITVKAQAGNTKVYTLAVTRAKSTNSYLASLKMSAGTLKPTFLKTTTSYTVALSYAQTSTTVTPAVADKYATYTMTLDGKATTSKTVAVNPGQTRKFAVTVKAQAGNTKVYTITITRAKSTNAYLASLKPSAGTLKPTFLKTTTSYTVALSYAQTSTTVTPAVADKYATYTMTLDGKATTSKTVAMNPGQTRKLVITVKAQAGNTKAYTITITRAKSTNAYLASLSLSGGTLSPAFAGGTTSYTATLPSTQSSTTLSFALADKYAGYTMMLDGKATTSKTVALNPGQTRKFTVTVKAQAGNTKVYTITIARAKSTNAYLASLSLSGGTLSPAFAGATTSYTVTLPSTQSSTTLSFALADKYAGYTMTLDGAATTSKTITLSAGQTRTLVITVKAQAGNTKAYTVKITRPK